MLDSTQYTTALQDSTRRTKPSRKLMTDVIQSFVLTYCGNLELKSNLQLNHMVTAW